MNGAEPFRSDGGPLGVLLLHGFTGSPGSMRPLGEWFAGQGLSVSVPRLPGHGTSWEDLAGVPWTAWADEAAGALQDLGSRCPDVVVVGQSMGGAMGLHLAAARPQDLRALAVINPFVHNPGLKLAPLIRLFTRSYKLKTNDVKKPGADEVAYPRAPVTALGELGRFVKEVRSELPQVTVPLLVFRSTEDHLVKPVNSDLIMRGVASSDKELVPCPNSYHVASLDNDAEMIRERILEFARAHATSSGTG